MPMILAAVFAPALVALQTAPVAPAPSVAQPPATVSVEPAAMLLATCDADADARTTRAERDACLDRLFATAEGAGSGSIGFIAYADWAQRWLGDRNALPGPYELDRSGDGRITAAELRARFTGLFDRYDQDADGVLVRAELLTIRALPPGFVGGRARQGRR
jgi:hypothetical protein